MPQSLKKKEKVDIYTYAVENSGLKQRGNV